jgi:hypothetical protein
MSAITIQGYKFEVPEGALANIAVGYTLQDEGEAAALRQTKVENLRNNFATKVKAAMNGSTELAPEALSELQSAFATYATEYKFGVRAAGEPKQKLDPITREMLKLAKSDFIAAYKAKYDETPDKDLVNERAEQLLEKRRDDLMKRARAILKQRESAGNETLEAVGL